MFGYLIKNTALSWYDVDKAGLGMVACDQTSAGLYCISVFAVHWESLLVKAYNYSAKYWQADRMEPLST